MAIKTEFSNKQFANILSNYDKGKYKSSSLTQLGTVQSNYILHTTKGKFFFNYYENRTIESVLFESNLLKHLKDNNFPCSAPLKNKSGEFASVYNKKTYIIFEFVDGEHIKSPNDSHKKQLVEKIAKLHSINSALVFPDI